MKMNVTWLFSILCVVFLISTDGAPVENIASTSNMEDMTTPVATTLQSWLRSMNESRGDTPNVNETVLDVKPFDGDSTTPNTDQEEETDAEKSKDVIGSEVTNSGSEDKTPNKTQTGIGPRNKSNSIILIKESDENVTVINNMDEVISDSKGNGHTEDQIMTLEDVSGDNQSAFDEKSNSTPLSTEDSHYSTSPVQDLMSTQNQPLRHDMMQLPGNQQLGKHNESNMKTEPKTMSISSIEILENITKTENGNVSMVAADEVVDDSGTTQSNDIPTSIRTVDEHWTESTHVATESNMMKDQAKKIEDTDSLATEINVPDSKDDSSDMIGDKDNISEKASNGRTLDHADNSSTNDKDIFESKDTSSEMAHNKYRSDPEDEALDETLKQNWSESKDDSSDVSLEGENSEFDHNPKDMTGEKDTANQESQTVEVSQEH